MVNARDGQLRKASAILFTDWQPDSVRTSVGFSWHFGGPLGPGFGQAEADAAVAQLRDTQIERPITLTGAKPLTLFSATNEHGAVMAGLIEFKRTVPSAADIAQSGGKPQAIVHVRHFIAQFPSIDYPAKVPAGYALRATANMGKVKTITPAEPYDYTSSWFRSPHPTLPKPEQQETQREALEAQLQKLHDQGPIPVVLGVPKLLFSVTNDPGEFFQRFLELLGPNQDAVK